jgi:hypothetical protein
MMENENYFPNENSSKENSFVFSAAALHKRWKSFPYFSAIHSENSIFGQFCRLYYPHRFKEVLKK